MKSASIYRYLNALDRVSSAVTPAKVSMFAVIAILDCMRVMIKKKKNIRLYSAGTNAFNHAFTNSSSHVLTGCNGVTFGYFAGMGCMNMNYIHLISSC